MRWRSRTASKVAVFRSIPAGGWKESVEVFTIELKGEKEQGELSMFWGNTVLKAPFTAK